jgi:hypothetical protein
MAWICQKFGRTYVDESNRRRGQKIYQAFVDTPTNDLTALADLIGAGYPVLGEVYQAAVPPATGDPYLVCVSIEVKEQGRQKQFYEIVCDYDISPYNDWKLKVTTRTVEYVLTESMADAAGAEQYPKCYADTDKYLHTKPNGQIGEPIVNRAIEPFDPPVMASRYQTVLDCSILVSSFENLNFGDPVETTLSGIQYYLNKVNIMSMNIFGLDSDSSTEHLPNGCDPWTLLVEAMDVEKVRRADGGCDLQVSVRIVYDPKGHCDIVLNQGTKELKAAGKKVNITDDGQVSTGTPMLLDKDGKKLATASAPTDATYIICPKYETADLRQLHLPELFCGNYTPPTP